MTGRRSSSARHVLAAAVMALLLVLLAACGDDDSSGTKSGDAGGVTKLRVAYVPTTTVLPLHVAKEQGFFERNRLDVTLTEAANISNVPATLGRQFDVALGTATDLIRAGSAGVDVVQVSGNTVSTKANPFVQLIVRPDGGIKDVKGLEGKKVGTPTLSGVIHAAVQYWAKQEGADPTKIRAVEVPSPNLPDQLKAGRIDAVEALEPFATTLQKNGNVSLGDPFSAIADPLATNFWIAQGKWAGSHQDVVARYVKSLEEARTYIEQNEKPARVVLQGYTNLPKPIAAKVPLPTWDFEVRTEDLTKWVAVLKDIGGFEGDVDPQKLVLSGGG